MILIVAVIYTSSQLVAIAHRAPPHQYRVITYNGNQKYAEKCSPPSVLLLLLLLLLTLMLMLTLLMMLMLTLLMMIRKNEDKGIRRR